MATQKEVERKLWASLLGYVDGMSFEEAAESVGVDTNTKAEQERFSKARERVANEIWKRTR